MGVYINETDKKAKTAIYIPNMDADTFEKICQEKGLQFVYVEVPEHGRLGDLDVLIRRIPIPTSGALSVDIFNNIKAFIENSPTIIPADKEGDE